MIYDSTELNLLTKALPFLANGLAFSLALTASSALFGIIFGTLVAFMRLSNSRVMQTFAYFYVSIFRSIPLLLVIFWFYFLMPVLVQSVTGSRFPVPIGPVYAAFITFAVFEAAFFSEIIRAGIQSVATGQSEAAKALQLSPIQRYRYIIMPQAISRMLPVLLTQTIVLFQDTSMVYVLSLPDFLGVAARIGQREGQIPFFFLVVAAVYFVICFSLTKVVAKLNEHSGRSLRA